LKPAGVAHAALFSVIVALASAPVAFADTAPCRDHDLCPQPTVNSDGYNYSFEDGSVVATPVLQASSRGPAMEFLNLPACFHNRPPSGDGSDPGRDDNCLGALTSPRCAVGEILVWTYSRPAGSSQAWVRAGERCVGVRRVVPVAAVREAVREELAKRVADPRFEVRPGEATLVNLPLIAYATDSGRRFAADRAGRFAALRGGVVPGVGGMVGTGVRMSRPRRLPAMSRCARVAAFLTALLGQIGP